MAKFGDLYDDGKVKGMVGSIDKKGNPEIIVALNLVKGGKHDNYHIKDFGEDSVNHMVYDIETKSLNEIGTFDKTYGWHIPTVNEFKKILETIKRENPTTSWILFCPDDIFEEALKKVGGQTFSKEYWSCNMRHGCYETFTFARSEKGYHTCAMEDTRALLRLFYNLNNKNNYKNKQK